ncbi:MAG: 2-amino-4-hydroxy-6-hydroxymethyldihydropteridin epyrophosphokinae [Thermomicrobiales bacterium]|jgi:2-amino-4-hydroxy-6-hydroxymethyldihydropteridine diphosphokinase|nr:2-amino-4-hydroxy-6-hydroxymethyldihydropteridin epyrophosphokinae [Thermomicrobiales bacterium]MDF3039292.1 2-amino-4-hydroxy-6-hydroxymethyldihydropteridin epyrophosphokinae [Thermomicrobiales bacterium]
MSRPATAYIGLGANLGDRAATLREAARRLGELGAITAVSSFYETEPVGFREQPSFLNAVIALETDLPPAALFDALLAIERDLGRVRSFRNAPRTLDLDILLQDDLVMDTPELTLPHPRMHERAFVLAPLAEIAPDVRHPVFGSSAAELLAALPDQSGVAVWTN